MKRTGLPRPFKLWFLTSLSFSMTQISEENSASSGREHKKHHGGFGILWGSLWVVRGCYAHLGPIELVKTWGAPPKPLLFHFASALRDKKRSDLLRW